jgi:protein associated with RNAse G/E
MLHGIYVGIGIEGKHRTLLKPKRGKDGVRSSRNSGRLGYFAAAAWFEVIVSVFASGCSHYVAAFNA